MGLEDQDYVKRRAEALQRAKQASQVAVRDAVQGSMGDMDPAAAAAQAASAVPQPQGSQEGAAAPEQRGAEGAQGPQGTQQGGQGQPEPEPAQPEAFVQNNKPIQARVTKVSGGSPRKQQARTRAKSTSGSQIRDFPKKLLNAMAAGVFSEKAMDLTQRDAVAAFVYAHFGDATPDLLDGVTPPEAKGRILALSEEVKKKDSDLSVLDSLRLVKQKLDKQARQIEVLEMLLCYLVLDRTGSIPASLNAGKAAKQVDVRLDEVLEFSLQADEQGKSFKDDRARHYGRVKR